ncbi:hypothetical protein HNR19_002302 [Nocardioides thalensis]|uniref:Uncharacterized protein n=1 Tax=Nocardioides thalensis TaxID=1914755 RepID=A0A853C2N1_9ACTN|nr:hypothetical protein [Nocardioides thalensis]NYJ01604.1 hypothetical protein [Nocardioides thalensis]
MTRRGATIVVALSVTLAAGLSACGGDDRVDPTPRTVLSSTAPSPARTSAAATEGPAGEPTTAYAAWLTALARHDAATACALQAPELTIELRMEAILVDRAELGDPCVGFVALLWEDPAFESEIVDVSVTQLTEEDALLAVHLGQGEDLTQQTVRMVYHRAKWRVFSTEERTGEDESVPGDAARWVEAWCDLDPSMTREELVDAMGAPSGEYTVSDGGEPQLWWAQDQYDFRAYLDPSSTDGSVLELVGDYDALSENDRALLPCPELRS